MNRFLRLLPLLLLATACVSTTYESGLASGKGAKPPVFVDVAENGGLRAFGRDYGNVRSLARELARHGASASQKGGPEHVVLRCGEGTSLESAEAVRDSLVRNGIPAVTIQGPRAISTSLARDPDEVFLLKAIQSPSHK